MESLEFKKTALLEVLEVQVEVLQYQLLILLFSWDFSKDNRENRALFMAQTVSLDKTSGNTVSLPQISAKEENKSEIFFKEEDFYESIF